MAAASAMTAPVMVILQGLKQYGWWRNDWCKTAAPIIGMLLIILGMWAIGSISWDGAQIIVKSPWEVYKGLLQGVFAGWLGVIGYSLQKTALPENLRIFKPGPNNNAFDAAKENLPMNAGGAE